MTLMQSVFVYLSNIKQIGQGLYQCLLIVIPTQIKLLETTGALKNIDILFFFFTEIEEGKQNIELNAVQKVCQIKLNDLIIHILYLNIFQFF